MDATSVEAYEAIKPKMHAQHESIINALSKLKTATVSEIIKSTGLFPKTATNRLSELRTWGLVHPTGEMRRNPRGRNETVVRAA